MKTGIELIAIERMEQIVKHGREVEADAHVNACAELCTAATRLLNIERHDIPPPFGWDEGIWRKMMDKPYKERLIIAGALITAEIDRLNVGRSTVYAINVLEALQRINAT